MNKLTKKALQQIEKELGKVNQYSIAGAILKRLEHHYPEFVKANAAGINQIVIDEIEKGEHGTKPIYEAKSWLSPIIEDNKIY